MAVSNARVTGESPAGAGRKAVAFADTIRMSTYLVAFVVGDLEATDPVMVGATPLRVWCVPGKRHLARFALDVGAFTLEFFEGYYGLPYPGDKLDLLAIPDFAAGAMENLGAITFRETALLVNEAAASHAELRARRRRGRPRDRPHVVRRPRDHAVVERHLAQRGLRHLHGAAAVDAWKPEWKRWTTFGVSRAAAMGSTGCATPGPSSSRYGPRATARRCSTSSPTRRAPRCCACSSSTSAPTCSATGCGSTSSVTASATPRPPTCGRRSATPRSSPSPR